MSYPEIIYPKKNALELKDFQDMDYYAVSQYALPIELMMENAGLQLARVITNSAKKKSKIRIGVGNGNNGGGGLVAARRLAGWGYDIFIDAFTEISKELPAIQLQRALKFGAKTSMIKDPDIWVDAYLGFSQRLPLRENLVSRIKEANDSNAVKIVLDIPTGFLGDVNSLYFNADKIMTLAAPKRILYDLSVSTELLVADLGIPSKVYELFNVASLPFEIGGVLNIKRD